MRIEDMVRIAEHNARSIEEFSTIRGVLIDVQTGSVKATTVKRELESYYDALHCDLVDIVSRTIGGRRFELIIDDEGLLKSDALVSGVDLQDHPMLVGSVLVVQYAGGGELKSLTQAEINHVLRHIGWYVKGERMVPAIRKMDY